MKKLILLIFIFFAICQTFAQNSNNYPFNKKDSIQITGKIIGYQPSQDEHFITFSTYDLFGKARNQAIQIEDNGSFWIKLYQTYEGDIQLNYKHAYINVYAKPNQVLELDIYDAKVNREKNFEGAFFAKGELADINNYIFRFSEAFRMHPFNTVPDMVDKKQTDSAYASSVMMKLNEQLEFLDSFIKKNKVTDQEFINWQRSQLQYEAGKDILFSPFASKFNKDIRPSQLLAMIKQIPINNPNAYHNSAYYGFLNSLCVDQMIIININPIYDAIKAQNKKNTVGICLDEIDKFATGLTKQLLYYVVFLQKAGSASDPVPYLGRLNTVIIHPFLKEKLLKEGKPTAFEKLDVLARLNALKVKPALKQRLINLFAQYKGTSLYIDFWGDWCGPCMSELPSYPKLITALDGKPIKFLFLSTFTTEQSMLAIKEKFKINGDFVNLANDEVKIVNNVFSFHSYPSHFMVNNVGEVVSDSWKMASSTIQEKLKEIDRLLSNKQ